MAAPRGWFDWSAVDDGWFDTTLQVAAWFDEHNLDEQGGAPAVPSVASYSAPSSQPFPRRRSLAVYALACAFVPVVVSATTAAAGTQGGTPPLRRVSLQYQALTGPVVVPAGAAETVTLDKWASQPPGRPRVAWRPEGATVEPVEAPSAPVVALDWLAQTTPRTMERDGPAIQYAPFTGPVELVLDLDWLPTLAGPRARVLRPHGGTVAPLDTSAPAETITIDKWHGRPVDVLRRVLRPASITVAPLHVPDVTDAVPSLAWAPVTPEPRRRATITRGDSTLPPRVEAAPAVVVDWLPTSAAPVRRVTAQPAVGAIAPVYVADVTVTVPPLSWAPDAPDLIGRRTASRYDSTVEPFADQAPAETVTLDKWLSPWVPRPRVALKLEGGTVAPLYVPDVTQPITANAWAPTYPARVPGLRRSVVIGGHVAPVAPVAASQDSSPSVQGGDPPGSATTLQYQAVTGPVFVPAAETITCDKWHSPPADVVRRVLRPASSAVAPLYVPDVTAVAPLRSWAPSTADVVRLRRLVAEDYTVRPVIDLGVAEVVTLDKWHAPHVTITRRVLRPAGGTVAPLYVPDVTAIAPSVASWQTPPARVIARPTPRTDTSVTPLLVVVAEVVTLDKWHSRASEPVRMRRAPFGICVAPVPPVDLTVERWMPVSAVPVRRVLRPEGALVAPLYVADVTVVAPIRSWAPVYPDRVPAARHPVNVGGGVGRTDPPSPYTPTYHYIAIVPREDRGIVVRGESRAVTVAYESRLIVVPHESRVIVVPSDPRSAPMED